MAMIRKESLVTVSMDALEASLFEPEALKEIERTRPGYLLEGNEAVRRHYVVSVRRVSSYTEQLADTTAMFEQVKPRHTWIAEIEIGGVEGIWRIPGPVLERIMRLRDAIITEARSKSSKEAAEIRKGERMLATDTNGAASATLEGDDYDHDYDHDC